MSDGMTHESEPIPMVGGPRDGSSHPITFVLPFLDGGIPAEIVTFGDDFYRLSNDRKQWKYGGKMKMGKPKEPTDAE